MLLTPSTLNDTDTGSLSWSALLERPFEQFLREFVQRHPDETLLLLGAAEVSPESLHARSAAPSRHPQSWAGRLFDPSVIADHREFDRAALGCKHLHDVLTGNRRDLPVSDQTYDRLSGWVGRAVRCDEDIRAWFWALLFNDLGKLRRVCEWHAELGLPASVDHDRVLLDLLVAAPHRFPGFLRLAPRHREALVEGLRSGFNLGKAIQLECGDRAWQPARDLGHAARDLHLGHGLFDMLGATGAADPRQGSPHILNDDIVGACLDIVETWEPGSYRQTRAKRAGLSDDAPVALQRLVGMARVFDPARGARLTAAWDALPRSARAVLELELGSRPGNVQSEIEPQYAPALLANAAKADPVRGWTHGLLTLAEALFEARAAIDRVRAGHTERDSAYHVANLVELAGLYATDGLVGIDSRRPNVLLTADGCRVGMVDSPRIDAAAFTGTGCRDWLAGRRVAFVGLGGGSDGLQAAQVALSCAAHPACVVSVRTSRTASESATGAVGECRTIESHGGEIAPGVFRVLPASRGNGRFLEHLAAEHLPTYLVLDDGSGGVAARIMAAVHDAGGADTLVSVDTGGDSLSPPDLHGSTGITPDQDLRVLRALSGVLGSETLSLVLAPGVDSPPDAGAVLARAGARRIDFGDASLDILVRYSAWRDRMPRRWLGKTPLAWSAALSGRRGLVAIDIPAERVLDRRNPWRPFIRVGDAMAGGYVMPVDSHLAAVAG